MENRLKDTLLEFDRTRLEAKKLQDQFNAVKTKRSQLFNKAYGHISKKIDVIYKELTRTATHPLGGTAYLTLENNDVSFAYGNFPLRSDA
jgi:structural maintenance of chromosome 1